MNCSRKFDTIGLLLCKQQAELFASSISLPYGSYRFIKRFAYSSYCDEFDTLGILRSSSMNEAYLEEEAKASPDHGAKWGELTMHWIGYLYRCWSYIDNVPMRSLFRKVPPQKLRDVYDAYHALDVEEAISRLREEDEEGTYERYRRFRERVG